MFRHAIYWVPVVTVGVVAVALLIVGKPRPVTGARLYGGPTVGAPVLSWRVAVHQRAGGVETVLPLDELLVDVTLPGGARLQGAGRADAAGSFSVSFDLDTPLGDGPVAVVVRAPDRPHPLAAGAVRLERELWEATGRERGGWLRGRRSGELEVRVAPGQGAFAVPFEAPLWIDVRRSGRPVAGASLDLRVAGADLTWEGTAATDGAGRAVARLLPREHALEITAVAVKDDRKGRFEGMVPVVPGATRAQRAGDVIRVTSPIVRDEVFVSLVTKGYRFGGSTVQLEPDGQGGSRATLPVDPPAAPWWVVVSSERDMQSMARVGWPARIDPSGHGPPPRTFDVRDLLLLDGVAGAEAREEERVRRVRWLAAIFAAAAMGLVVTLLAVRVRAAQQQLTAHLRSAGAGEGARERMAPRGALRILIGIFCIALGFALIALLLMARW